LHFKNFVSLIPAKTKFDCEVLCKASNCWRNLNEEENDGKVKLVNLALLSWKAPEGSRSVQKARLPDVVILKRCNNKTIN
jgi:hypothetical protein